MGKLEHLEVTVQRTISDILSRDVKEDLGFITITGVHLTKDLSYCNVYYTVLGNNDKKAKTQRNLEKCAPFVRTMLVNRVKMRKAPQVCFRYDETIERATHLEKLISSIKTEE